MRIISKFKDCYDGLTSNSGVTYVRETSEITLDKEIRMSEFDIHRDNQTYNFHPFLLGFCGRVYPAWYLRDIENKQYKAFYSRETLVKEFPEVLERRRHSWGALYDAPHIDYISDQFHHRLGYGMPVDEELKFSSYFSVDTPAFVVYNAGHNRASQLIRNPLLRKYEVYKLFPIPLLFQEIEMYLGGLARPDSRIPKISDEDKISSHGFDKFSFRKDKAKQ